MRTVVHLLRHGEVHNPTGVLYGRLADYHLSPLGEKMAEAVAEAVAGRDVTHLVTSPLERARETVLPLAGRFRAAVTTDDRLVEAGNAFEGRRVGVGDGALRDPRSWWLLRNPFRPSWGEPYRDIAARMAAALSAARDAAAGHEAVCVSHQLPIWTLRRHLSGRRLWHDPRRRECALASLTSFTFDGDRLAEIGYTEPAAHLVAGSPDAGTAKGA
jgi:broad specificity phosphatase PhoE